MTTTGSDARGRMQVASKRLSQASNLASGIHVGDGQQVIDDWIDARTKYLQGRFLSRRQRAAIKRTKRMLTYPPSLAGQHRAAAFHALDMAALFRASLPAWHPQTRQELRNAKTCNTVAEHNGFYLP